MSVRTFHTYVGTERGLTRGLKELKATLSPFQIELSIAAKAKPVVLEIGTGKGNVLIDLCRKYPKGEFVGTNLYKSHGLSRTEQKQYAKLLNSTPAFIVANATKLPIKDKQFDVVLSQVCFMHITNKLKAIEEIYRVLKIGGTAYLEIDSWQCKKHKPQGEMPNIYVQMLKNFGNKGTPRIILRKKGKLTSFNEFVKTNNDFEVKSKNVSRDDSFTPSFRTILKITRSSKKPLKFNTKRDKMLSKELTNLPITNHNPASFGVVDVYEIL